MGLSYIGTNCLLVAFVIGYNREPDSPAKIIPLLVDSDYYTNER